MPARHTTDQRQISRLVGTNTRHHRLQQGLTLDDLADRVRANGVPLDSTQLSRIETGAPWQGGSLPSVTVDQLVALAAALHTDPAALLGAA